MTANLERPLLEARTSARLHAALAHGAMELCEAQSVAFYVVDATGRTLRPLASEGTYAVGKLPDLGLGWDRQQSDVVAALQTSVMFAQGPSAPESAETFRQQLFATRGWLLALRLEAPCSDEDASRLKAGTGVLFANLAASPPRDMEHSREVLGELFDVFLKLRPLVDAYENKDEPRVSPKDKQAEGWARLNAALSERLVGTSAQISEMRSQIARYATRDYCILVQGETGTGKELAARALHRLSTRSGGPWVAENCSALPENLIESELFGYEKGAFTGADQAREGLMMKASGGTLFLDEIGDLPLSLQAKLLRVLQERKIRPLGARTEVEVDFRLITATHKDLRKAVETGTFRADLYHRIAQLTLKLPPLRDRFGDITYLARYFLSEMAAREDQPVKLLSDDALERLETHPFTGNIRELQNCMIRAALLAVDGSVITGTIIDEVLHSLAVGTQPPLSNEPQTATLDAQVGRSGLQDTLALVERDLLTRCHEQFAGNRQLMASHLKIPRRTLANKLARYCIGSADTDATVPDPKGH